MSHASELTNKIIHELYTAGAFCWRAESAGVFDRQKGLYRTAPKKGVADILACFKGRLIVIEVKIGKDRLSPEQDGFLQNVEHAGGSSYVARTFEEFRDWWRVHHLSS
jgi:Holliday junction resolvase